MKKNLFIILFYLVTKTIKKILTTYKNNTLILYKKLFYRNYIIFFTFFIVDIKYKILDIKYNIF